MATNARFVHHIGMAFGERPVEGRSRSTLEVQEIHRNGTGVVHGGVMFTMADTAMGAALISLLEPGQICATIEVKISYFKPVFEGTLVCTAEVVNKGKKVAMMESSLHLGDVLVARASGSFAIFARKPAA